MSVSGRNCVASESAAADSTDGDDKEKIKAEADLLENVFIYLTEGTDGYQEEMSANQKRVIRKKAANFKIENGDSKRSAEEKMRSVYAFHSNFFDGSSCCIATCISVL